MTEENGKYELLVQKLAQKISEKEYQLTVYEVELESSQEIIIHQNNEIEKLKKALLVADKKIKELESKLYVEPIKNDVGTDLENKE